MIAKSGAINDKELFFTILHTNDEHSALIPHGPAIEYHLLKKNNAMGGFARLASFIKDIRNDKDSTGEPVLLLSSGDIIGSNPFSWLINHGYAAELDIMKKIGYDFITVGNHELHQGMDILAEYFKTAGYPQSNPKTVILGTNLLFPEDHPLSAPGFIKKTQLKLLENGLKIGFLGVLGYDAIEVVEQTQIEGVDISDPVKASQKAVEELRRQGAEVIVAVNHAGAEINKKMIRDIDGIDIIIGGHEHIVLTEPIIEKGTIIVEAGECLKYAGTLELAFNSETKKLRLRNHETGRRYLTPLDDQISTDEEIASYINTYTEKLNKLVQQLTDGKTKNILQPVASVAFDMPNTPRREDNSIGNFATDAMRLLTEKLTGERVDVAFQGTGLFRLPLVTGKNSHALHQVSFYDLAEVLEIATGPDGEAGTPMVSFYLTGRELWLLTEICVLAGKALNDYYTLQISGLRFEYDSQRAVLFKVPAMNLPLPTFRAVQKVEIFTGKGRQTSNDNDYMPLKRKDSKLYHVVTDYMIAKTAISYINKKIPLFNIELKNREGNTIKDLDQAIIKSNGKEYKIWQAINDYASSQPVGKDGLPEIDEYYNKTSQRIITVKSNSSPKWFLWALLPISAALLIYYHNRRK